MGILDLGCLFCSFGGLTPRALIQVCRTALRAGPSYTFMKALKGPRILSDFLQLMVLSLRLQEGQ